jgi:predicted glycoside hydrolase/deacetylase ChbG (UPF0249 family)
MICADDYGLDKTIDDACHVLLADGCISGVSCMTRSPHWPRAAAALKENPGTGKAGLHLDLTEGWDDGRPSYGLAALLLRSGLRLLDREAIAAEFRRQFDDYEDALQKAPDFVDGHQHIHEFPVLQDIMLTEMQRRYSSGLAGARPWIRSTGSKQAPEGVKGRLLDQLGNAKFREKLQAAGFASNKDFAGIYGFSASAEDYGRRMEAWLAAAEDGSVLMCHPAKAPVEGDAIAAARQEEFRFLSSAAFKEMLERHDIAVTGNFL